MIFHDIGLSGAYLIDPEPKGDERGFFIRTFCTSEFADHDLETAFVQANTSWSAVRGTLRGMHYQLPPKSEVKLVRCVRGSVHDVILDLRPDSVTFGRSFGTRLSAANRRAMYVPRGFAHGFLTLEPDCEVHYLVSAPYAQERERGIRWNDPHFAITWPFEPSVLSPRDCSQRDFDPHYHLESGIGC